MRSRAILPDENEVVIQTTRNVRPGEEIGMRIGPDEIHVMPAGVLMNVFDGTITKEGRAAFAGGEYECDLTQLFDGSVQNGPCSVVYRGRRGDQSRGDRSDGGSAGEGSLHE